MKPLQYITITLFALASVFFGCGDGHQQHPYRTDTYTYFVMPDTLGPFVKHHYFRKMNSDSDHYIGIDSMWYVLWDSSTLVHKKVVPSKERTPTRWITTTGKNSPVIIGGGDVKIQYND